jgi:hypothetical protein
VGEYFFRPLAFVAGMIASLLPHRLWRRLPSWLPMESAACVSGVATLFLGAAIGIPGFLEHAAATVSLANETMLEYDTWSRGMAGGFSGLSIFTFLLLTPKGWATLYLGGSGAVRAAAAWFDDPIGDPIATIVDSQVFARRERRGAIDAKKAREALEGPEISDRLVSSTAAGIPGCDFVIVSSRRKPGWERGVVVFTPAACYRIGEPVERTITGRLRTLYPLSEHKDLEAVRKSVEYDLPTARSADAASEPGRMTADRTE